MTVRAAPKSNPTRVRISASLALDDGAELARTKNQRRLIAFPSKNLLTNPAKVEILLQVCANRVAGALLADDFRRSRISSTRCCTCSKNSMEDPMQSRYRCALAVGLLSLFATASATAEPITIHFDIHVFQRVTFPAGIAEPFDASFALAMTFDPASSSDPARYGLPSFSPDILELPVPVPPVPAGISLQTFGGTTHTSGFASASLGVGGGVPLEGPLFQARLFLENRVEDGEPITPETFGPHLGLPLHGIAPYNFLYDSCAVYAGPTSPETFCTGRQLQHVQYFGLATFTGLEAPAVPEPSTIALVGGGLAALIKWGRRKAAYR
jgi:PEP-CTERM motif-containing protein